MLGRRTILLLLLVFLVFAIGIGQLFVLRFSRGDIYPPYSSFRADPIGAKALYDALDGLDDWQVERNQSPIRFLVDHPLSTVVYLGVPARYFTQDSELKELEKLALTGHRIIIGLLPESKLPGKDKAKPTPGETPAKEATATEQWQLELVNISDKLPEPILLQGLDQPISYHSGVGFSPKNSAWRTLARVGLTPVVVERAYGLGSVVLLADSYPFSNEALRKERRPNLLTSVLGKGRSIIFEETHFGVSETPGVATLARRYRLHGIVGVCLLLGILFLWRNLTPLFSRPGESGEKEIVLAGQDAHSGLLSLLHRGVEPKELPALCLSEWIKSAPRNYRSSAVVEAGQIATEKESTPLSRLARINQLLNPSNLKHHGKTTS